MCRAGRRNVDYRLDTTIVHEFLSQFGIPLP